jgi:transcriptional regulator with XRE-family HTH domain
MMTSNELQEYLTLLGLEQAEAAQLLSVSPRTLRRWLDGEEVPGPVEQAFKAWRRLHDRKLIWRPDTVSIIEDDQGQIAGHRNHAIELSEALRRVEERGGPRMPWLVDRQGCRAILGPMEVTFHKLASGSFSLANYRRSDSYPDVQRDREFIDDATFYIAKEMRKEAAIPVTLVYMDEPNFVGPDGKFGAMRHEEFPTTEAAIERACTLIDKAKGHSFTIREGTTNSSGDFLWSDPELRAERDRRIKTGARIRRRV